MIFEQRLKETRIKKGLTQQGLADIVGTTQVRISSFETGKYKPSYRTLIKLAEELNISLDYLTGHEL